MKDYLDLDLFLNLVLSLNQNLDLNLVLSLNQNLDLNQDLTGPESHP